MPIARLKPDTPAAIEINTPKIEPVEYKSVIHDEKEIPLQSLLAYVEGAPWTVNYYSQLLSKHNDLRDYDPGQPDLYQQYQKIHQLELRVTAALTDSYDSETGITRVNGSAHVPSCLVPNVGDIFIANIDHGDDALFRVTLVERKTFNRQSIFYIEYELYGLRAQHPEWFLQLDSKTQREFYFHKDRLIDRLDALVTPATHEVILQARQFLKSNIEYYFKTFFNKTYSTLVLPHQSTTFYDPLLVRFILRIVNSFQAPEIRLMNNLTIDQDPFLSQPTIWDLLLQPDFSMVEMINQRMGWITAKAFFRDPTIEGARYQRMQYFVYPIEPDESLKTEFERGPKPALFETLTEPVMQHALTSMLFDTFTIENKTIPMTHRPFKNGYYVMSEDFYRFTENKSYLDILVTRYLRHEALAVEDIMKLLRNYKRWSRLEQFYFSPVIWILLKSILGDIAP